MTLIADHDHPLDEQETFNIAWRWAQTHGPCVTDGLNGACAYRRDGNACLIGACIPDSKLDDSLIAYPIEIRTLAENCHSVLSVWTSDISIAFLTDLQAAHDTTAWSQYYPAHVINSLKQVASDYGLSIPSSPAEEVTK